MKKWYMLLFLIFIGFLWLAPKKTASPVFEEKNIPLVDENNFVLQKIDVSNASLTTKNITSILGTLSLSKVEYEVPKLYRSLFAKDNLSFSFHGVSEEKGLSNIERELSNRFKSFGYQKEVERIYFYGVKLSLLEVYGREKEIEAFERKTKNL